MAGRFVQIFVGGVTLLILVIALIFLAYFMITVIASFLGQLAAAALIFVLRLPVSPASTAVVAPIGALFLIAVIAALLVFLCVVVLRKSFSRRRQSS